MLINKIKERLAEIVTMGVWVVASALVSYLRKLDPTIMFSILAVAGLVIIAVLSHFLRSGAGSRDHRQLRNLESEVGNLRQQIKQYDSEGRSRRIEFRKPLLTLPDLLSNLEKQLNKQVTGLSQTKATPTQEFGELTYYTSRLKQCAEQTPAIVTTNQKINDLLLRMGDSELISLVNNYRTQLNGYLAGKCFGDYMENHKKLTFDNKFTMGKAREVTELGVTQTKAKLSKRWEDLCCMGVESKS